MSRGYRIVDIASGASFGVQTWPDSYAPIVSAGQKAVPFTAGGGNVLSATFSGTGQSASLPVFDYFNVSLWGTFSASVALERSFDGGTTWSAVAADGTGTPIVLTAPASIVCREPEASVLYRLNCTAYTSGTVNYRISQ